MRRANASSLRRFKLVLCCVLNSRGLEQAGVNQVVVHRSKCDFYLCFSIHHMQALWCA